MAQVVTHWRAFATAVMNLRFSQKAGNSVTCLATVSFSDKAFTACS
jgi:hypothetical protein